MSQDENRISDLIDGGLIKEKEVTKEGKQITLKILEKLRNHYLNTLTIDETDRKEFDKVEKAIKWVNSINQ